MSDKEIVDLFIAHGAHGGVTTAPRGYRRLYCDVAEPGQRDEISAWVRANGGEWHERLPEVQNTGLQAGKLSASVGDARPAERYWIVPLEALGLRA